MVDRELEGFKTSIDLRAYAADLGYVWDRKESWRGSTVMRAPDGDKIVIKRDADEHYVYFSVRRDGDSGSIIDFMQNRQRLNLGFVRKELRAWTGWKSPALPPFPALPKTGKDRIRVETEFARMQETGRHPYLENERGLPTPLLDDPRFAGPDQDRHQRQRGVSAFRSGWALRL